MLSPFRKTARRAAPLACALSAFALLAAPAHGQDADALYAQGQRLLEEADALSARSEISQSNWTRGEARTALRQACELEHIEACKAYAQSRSAAAFLGDQRSMDEQYWGYGRACDLGDAEGCLELGDARSPIGLFAAPRTPENWAAAAAAYRRACEEHATPDGCFRLADLLGHNANPNHDAQARRIYGERACAMGFQPACDMLASARMDESGAQGAPTLDPLLCAQALYLVSTDGPQHVARATAEARAAVQAHIAAHGGDQLQLENQVVAAARTRLQAVQSGAQSPDAVRRDVQACRRQFGFQP
jgi:hypothetical protein